MRHLFICVVTILLFSACAESTKTENTSETPDTIQTGEPVVKDAAKGSLEEYKSRIIGTWESEDDANAALVFTADKQLTIYEGEMPDTSNYTLGTKSCMEGESQPGIIYLNVDNELCYSIENLDEQTLALMYLERGNVLVYKRRK